KRNEQMGTHIWRDPRPGVLHGDLDPPIPRLTMLTRSTRKAVVGTYLYPATAFHSLDGVTNEVDQYLAKLLCIPANRGQIGPSAHRQFAIRAFCFKNARRTVHDLGHIYLSLVGTCRTRITEH